MRVQSLGQEGSLEEEMASHSSILAGTTPWTEERGGYSPWSCKVRRDLNILGSNRGRDGWMASLNQWLEFEQILGDGEG